jgi:hypothetical protein
MAATVDSLVDLCRRFGGTCCLVTGLPKILVASVRSELMLAAVEIGYY